MGSGGCGGGGRWWLILAMEWLEQWVELLPILCSTAMREEEKKEESVCFGFLYEITYGLCWLSFGLNKDAKALVKKWLFTNQI